MTPENSKNVLRHAKHEKVLSLNTNLAKNIITQIIGTF